MWCSSLLAVPAAFKSSCNCFQVTADFSFTFLIMNLIFAWSKFCPATISCGPINFQPTYYLKTGMFKGSLLWLCSVSIQVFNNSRNAITFIMIATCPVKPFQTMAMYFITTPGEIFFTQEHFCSIYIQHLLRFFFVTFIYILIQGANTFNQFMVFKYILLENTYFFIHI